MKPLRIAIADDEPDMRDYFRKILPRLGHQVAAVAENGRELVAQCRECKPDLVITDIRMPELDGIDAASAIYQAHPVPVILVSAYHDAELVERAEADHVMGYLVKPIKQADLEPTIALALRRFEQFQELRQQAADLRQALDDRKIIERAKGMLVPKEAIERVEQQVRERLQDRVQGLRLLWQPNGLVLQGRTRTYYIKQLAQSELMAITDCAIAANEIQVG